MQNRYLNVESTLLGVLSHSELDNGRGKSRLNLLRHRHEIETGRTSSISHQIIGFNPKGELINYQSAQITTWEQICETASKLVTFLDMCGHPKYQKTTISGLSGHAPDYACLILGANAGAVSEIPREHLGLSVLLKVPVFVVITKIDIATPEQLGKTVTALLSLLKSPGVRRVPMVIQNEDDLVVAVSSMVSSQWVSFYVSPFPTLLIFTHVSNRVIPIFLTSNVTGENVDLLVKFFNLLPKPAKEGPEVASDEVEYCIEETYNVQCEHLLVGDLFTMKLTKTFSMFNITKAIGCVIGGILQSGTITVYSGRPVTYYLGPDRGRFIPVKINSLQRQRCPVNHISRGQAATMALSFFKEPPLESQPSHDANGNGLEYSGLNEETDSLTPPQGFKIRKGQVILTSPPNGALNLNWIPFSSSAAAVPLGSPYTFSSSSLSRYIDYKAAQHPGNSLSPSSPGGAFGQTPKNIFRSTNPNANNSISTADAVWEFYADLSVLNSSASGITAGVQGVLYIGSVRQGARVIKLRDDTGHWAELVNPNISGSMSGMQSSSGTNMNGGNAAGNYFFLNHSNNSRAMSPSLSSPSRISSPTRHATERRPSSPQVFSSQNNNNNNNNNGDRTDSPGSPSGSKSPRSPRGVKAKRMSGVIVTGFDLDGSSSWSNPVSPVASQQQQQPRSPTQRPQTPTNNTTLTNSPSATTKSNNGGINHSRRPSTSNTAITNTNTNHRSSPTLSPTSNPTISGSSDPLPSLKTGTQGRVRFRFAYEPEWVKVGATVIFRGEGRMKCIGKVVSLVEWRPVGYANVNSVNGGGNASTVGNNGVGDGGDDSR
jgi:GTPase